MTTTTSTEEVSDLVGWLYPGIAIDPETAPEITITGPVDGIWTIEAPDSVTKEELDAAIALQLQSVHTQRNFETLLTKASTALEDNALYLSFPAPALEEITAQVEALTRQVNLMIRLRLNDYNDISDT